MRDSLSLRSHSPLRSLKIFLFSFTSILISTPWSQASSFMPTPFPSAVQDAPIIIRGKVGMSYPDFAQDPDGTKRIFTFTEIQLTEVLKGNLQNPPSSLIIRELGGEKDGVGYHVPGTAQFERGEDIVIFLKKPDRNSVFDVQGMMMGKFSIQVDSEGQEILTGLGLSAETSPSRWTIGRLRKLIQQQTDPNSDSSPTPSQSSSSSNFSQESPKNAVPPQAPAEVSPVPAAEGALTPTPAASIIPAVSDSNSPWISKWRWELLGILFGLIFLGGLFRFRYRK